MKIKLKINKPSPRSSIPKVSVLLPVYNAARYLAEAVESILQQTLSDFELIIVEDGSTDDSPQMIRKYAEKDSRIRPIFLNKNTGLAHARQKALEQARAPFVACMDADDISLAQRLQSQYEYLQANDDVGMVGCDYYRFENNENGEKKMIKSLPMPIINASLGKTLYQTARVVMCIASAMYRRELALQVGGYRGFFKNGAEDRDFALKMHELARIANISQKLYCYRIHRASTFRKNKRALKANNLMARFCALQRRKGLPDPIDQARPLDKLPKLLGLPSSVTLTDLQQDHTWIAEKMFQWLTGKPFKRKVLAQIYLGLLAYRLSQNNGMKKALECLMRALKLDITCLNGFLKKTIVNCLLYIRQSNETFTNP